MSGRIESGDLIEIAPLSRPVRRGDIVLATVRGNDYVHLVEAVKPDGRAVICNNHGYTNGVASKVHGIVVAVNPKPIREPA